MMDFDLIALFTVHTFSLLFFIFGCNDDVDDDDDDDDSGGGNGDSDTNSYNTYIVTVDADEFPLRTHSTDDIKHEYNHFFDYDIQQH